MFPHPLIRLLLLLVFAGLLPWLELPLLGGAALLLLAVCLFRPRVLADSLRALRRLRWLLLAIAVLYLWFTPGTPLVAGAGDWLPTREGVWLALRRCGVLVLMLTAVYLVMQTTPRPALTAALVQLASVVRLLGFRPEPFARRLVAALDAVPGMQALVGEMRSRRKEEGLLAAAAGVISAVEFAARQESTTPEPPRVGAPPWWQWLLPLLLLAAGLYLLLQVNGN